MRQADSTTAELLYLDDASEPPVSIMTDRGDGTEESCGTYTAHRVAVASARRLKPAPELDRQGFQLLTHTSSVADFYDDEQVRGVYYDEVRELVSGVTGAAEVVVFDHNTRAGVSKPDRDPKAREPVYLVHNDFTPRSGRDRVRRELGEERACALASLGLAIINVWRPITGPVRSSPLAVCDATTLGPADLIPADMVYEHRRGAEYRSRFNTAHRWYYYPELTPGELLLLKVCDTREDGRAIACLHTAFDDPHTPAGAPPRESIELRVMAFFD